MLNCSLDHKKLGERTGEKSLFVVLSLELHKYVLLVAVEVVLPGVKDRVTLAWQKVKMTKIRMKIRV